MIGGDGVCRRGIPDHGDWGREEMNDSPRTEGRTDIQRHSPHPYSHAQPHIDWLDRQSRDDGHIWKWQSNIP